MTPHAIRSIFAHPGLKFALGSLILAGATLVGPQAHALDVGAHLGVGWVNNGFGNELTWGLEGHADILPAINAGLYWQTMGNDINVGNGATVTEHVNIFAAEANLKLTSLLDGAYVGAKLGLEVTSFSSGTPSATTNLVLGPAVGYDYMLGSGLSIGGQANFLFWTASSPNPTNTFDLLAVLKYTFF